MASWRGVTTRRLYAYLDGHEPAALLDAQGHPIPAVPGYGVGGETILQVNHDGSPAMSVATSGPSPYVAYVQRSLWDSA